ncbi:McrC family protein [Pyrococcus kukulkanii]|uniref:McrC family protein n=1 Tax=Pyrococcus kukulkanii TaxID=1609559 RepID=UPI00083517BD|nr:hypothetical protein [Pyrococcus kukulkanii]
MPSITLFEHEPREVDESVREAIKLINRALPRPTSTSNDSPQEEFTEENGFFQVTAKGIKAKHYVGFAFAGDLSIQVLPKVFKSWGELDAIIGLMKMLNVSYGLNIYDVDLATFKSLKAPRDIFEVLVFLYAKSLWEEILKGYHREYVQRISEEKFLRGKLLVGRQILKLPHKMHEFTVEIHEFTQDNLLNQIFYFTTRFALSKTRWEGNKRLLESLMLVFADVAPKRITPRDFERVHFTRLNERFRKPFNLAKIILGSIAEGAESVGGFFVDMNELFERFILWALRSSGFRVHYQRKFWFVKDVLKARPDYVIEGVGVADAKYREWNAEPDILRQIYVYSKILEFQGEEDRAFLIFPRTEGFNKDLEPQELEFFDGSRVKILPYDLEVLREGYLDLNFRNYFNNQE